MSISTTAMRVDHVGLAAQKIAQPGAAGKPQAGLLKAPSVNVPDQMSKMAAAQALADARQGEAGKLSAEQARQTLQEINKVMDALSISVQFQIDPDYKEVIIKVVDQDTGKVIRQLPSEDVVRVAKALDNLKGLLFAQAV
ncbi:MAG: flagellar protein FlaG [Rhodoferax sp.]|uniref:flagellar protein FlaG n=1 Tax=Rhodoferax sp. TaxID=50421 RepID=UPI002625B7E6|nr:flagellar protein FlaG [Rhodoferax sp.]MDD5335619.1 flagellar protein FlaG [Rhodoferax sp.]